MAVPRPRVFNIPASAPFLTTLISALVEGRLVSGFPGSGDPLALASATIYLPTRRACRLARDCFLNALGSDAALLPRLAPIGDIDADELIFAEASGPLALDLPPAVEPLERRLLLAQLVLKWARSPDLRGTGHSPLVANNPGAALALADALARLIDDMTTRGVAWSELDELVPDHLDEYWNLTLKFLQVVRDRWPQILSERGAIEPAARRDRLIAAEAARLQAADSGPVIAAGSTASMPATALLLGTIARLPRGAVVLPGLDTDLDEPSWQMIGGVPVGTAGDRLDPSIVHPQYAMQHFLLDLGMRRDEVVSLSPTVGGRERIVSEALRPAVSTDRWSERLADDSIGDALAEVAVIEAAGAEEEALAIAVALRETLDSPGKTAALVTPDRALARRVIAALARWNVAVDDSGGDALADTPAGVFARLAAEAALGGLEPVTLLALLKHPLLRLGAGEDAHAFAISVLERALLRGPRPRPGAAGLAAALTSMREHQHTLHRGDPRARLSPGQLDLADVLVARLRAALARLEDVGIEPRPLAELATRHRDVLWALAQNRDAVSSSDDIDALLDALDDLAASASAATLHVAPAEYPEIFEAALAGLVVRRPLDTGARVRIFGLLEARLQHPDRMVLGGLVEGVWPPQTRSDPWLSRPMRQKLGLDLPERRIGLTAHDFAQALGSPEVILSRAAKVGGAPTVPSRLVQRLAAVAGETHWDAARRRGMRYVEMARSLDRPAQVRRILAPAPKPPGEARPARLSVTEIEHWLRDPYTIYAKHILGLSPLDAVDTPPGARDRGSAIHAAIEKFTKEFHAALPPDPLAALLVIGAEKFAPLGDFPEAKAFWWPRFERIAHWFVDWEQRRRPQISAIHAEARGEVEIDLDGRTFKLVGRADRIERLADGSHALLDYKTGRVATERQVRRGLAPQLTLEAAMLQRNAFPAIAAGAEVTSLAYVQLKGGEPPGFHCPIEWKDTSPAKQAANAFARLRELLLKFEDEQTPYRSLVHPMWSTRYGDYDHLARIKEWSAFEDDDIFGSPP